MKTCDHSRFKETMAVCPTCDRLYRAKQAALVAAEAQDPRQVDPPCIYRLDQLEDVPCHCPRGNRKIASYGCEQFGQCTVSKIFVATDRRIVSCRLCNVRKEKSDPPKKGLTWQVGLTTILKRKDNLLARTLISLARAGWENPRLFVDGGSLDDWRGCQYPITVHEKTHAYGNWWLGMQELYVRNPLADRYLMVQDDVIFVKGLRNYLDAVPWPGPGYLNLYTMPKNHLHAAGKQGFFQANQHQRGLGALALVFDHRSIVKLLASEHMIEKFRPADVTTGQVKERHWRAKKAIDGGVVDAMGHAGMVEWCHNPSLVQHTGGVQGEGPKALNLSQLGHRNPDSPSFPGEGFDARTLLP
jgi:hypothetical protein